MIKLAANAPQQELQWLESKNQNGSRSDEQATRF